jgi:hypothetical protein
LRLRALLFEQVSPHTKHASSHKVELPAGVWRGLDEAQRGETIALTKAELDHWAETGELPEHIEAWAASLASRGNT